MIKAFALLLLSSIPAWSHIGIMPPGAPSGGRYTGAFRIPHGCDGASMDRLTLTIPAMLDAEGVEHPLLSVKPQMPDGNWKITMESRTLDPPYMDYKGNPVNETISKIIWEGTDPLPNEMFQFFGVSFKLPPVPEGDYSFPIRQDCLNSDGTGEGYNDWSDLSEGAMRPPPRFVVTESDADDEMMMMKDSIAHLEEDMATAEMKIEHLEMENKMLQERVTNLEPAMKTAKKGHKKSKKSKKGDMVETPETPDLHAEMGPYTDYTGELVVSGHISVNFNVDDTMRIAYELEGLGADCMMCALHVHSGTTCDDPELVGGHYTSPELDDHMVWMTAHYSSDSEGKATGTFMVNNGYSMEENLGHPVVVHDADKNRIACGILEQ